MERLVFLRRIHPGSYEGSRRTLEIAITRKLGIIASIGSNAPYIGLLGTVLGIMLTFYTIGIEGYVSATRIMVGARRRPQGDRHRSGGCHTIHRLYNTLLRRVKVILLEWDERHE